MIAHRSTLRNSLAIALLLAVGGLIAGAAQIASPPSFVLKWGMAGNGPGQFNDPEGVTVGPDGRIYLLDTENHRLQIFDPQGKFLAQWGSFCELNSGKGCQDPDGSNGPLLPGDGQFKEPEGMAIAPDGTVYVADSGNDRIEIFDPFGKFIARWGTSGAGAGQLSNPVGLALNKQGDLFVADTLNQRIEVFDASHKFLRAWGSKGSAEGQFQFPSGVAVDLASGVIYVTDNGNHRVQRFNPLGAFMGAWGNLCALVGDQRTPAGTGCQAPRGEGEFKLPFGIALDWLGNVYVVDQGNRRIQAFDSTGRFLVQWGSPCELSSGAGCTDPDGPGPLERGDGQFLSPKGIAIAPDGTVYIADSDNNRVQAFRSRR